MLSNLVVALAAGATFVGFWLRFGAMINKAQATADQARDSVDELKAMIHEGITQNKEQINSVNKSVAALHNKLTIQQEAFGLYRERIANDYVNNSTLGRLETRLVETIREATRTSNDTIDKLAQRIDRYNNSSRPAPPK